jgi:NADPH2:quinone reductase
MRAIQFSSNGGPEVLDLVEVDDPTPVPTQAVVQVDSAGLNFIDTYHRSGLYDVNLPFRPGVEGSGTVVSVGDDVSEIAVGDRVAWAGPAGSYADLVSVDASRLVSVPDSIGLDSAAAVMLQGMTAHYLAIDTHSLQPGDKCLIHAGAGGVGLLLTQIAKLRGAEVFTTVGSAAKAELSSAAGADHVINYNEENFAEVINENAGPNALAVVYDGVGASVFDDSLALLRKRGVMATFGNASGPVPPVSPLALSAGGSLFLTRPTLFDYIATRNELLSRAQDLFDWIAQNKLSITISQRIPLASAAEAHRMLEGRETYGKVLLQP